MSRHGKINKKLILLIVILCAVVLLAGVVGWILLTNRQPLVGTWVYDEYTQYVFEKNGDGCLEVDDVHYGYSYRVFGDQLYMDFTEDVVRDCVYTFSVKDGVLTFIGGKNTDGGTYTLHLK